MTVFTFQQAATYSADNIRHQAGRTCTSTIWRFHQLRKQFERHRL